MNDPFAMLNPIDKPKTAPVYGGPPAAPVHSVGGGYGGHGAPGMGMNMGGGMGMGMGGSGMGMNGGGFGGMAPGMAPGMGGGMGGMPLGMGGMHSGMGGMPPGMGGMPPGMGGMNPGMVMGMGGQPQQGGQAPIMYDNIKNLLQQKPKPAGAMRDDTSMDFLENLGNGKANSISVTSPTAAVPSASPFGAAVDPFGGPAPAAPTVSATVSLGTFEFPGESSSSSSASNSVSPSNGGAKSNALADRLANGRRKTQEAQRQQLGFNAGAFTQTTGAPRISLKDMAPQSSGDKADRGSRAPSLEDFAAGKPVFYESDPFGASSASAATTGGNSSRTNSRTNSGGSNSHSSKQQSFGSSYSASLSAPSAFDDNSGGISVDSDADFESKLNGGSTGSSRNLSSGNLGGARTGSGGSSAAAKATMDFGW